jgi:hypothetical protein
MDSIFDALSNGSIEGVLLTKLAVVLQLFEPAKEAPKAAWETSRKKLTEYRVRRSDPLDRCGNFVFYFVMHWARQCQGLLFLAVTITRVSDYWAHRRASFATVVAEFAEIFNASVHEVVDYICAIFIASAPSLRPAYVSGKGAEQQIEWWFAIIRV